MWSFFLGMVTEPLRRFLQPALLVGLVALAGVCFFKQWQLGSERRAHDTTRGQVAELRAQRDLAAAQARQREQQMQEAIATTLDELEAARARNAQLSAHNDRLLAEVVHLRRTAADADRLREQLAAYAAGRTGDPAATCEDRAASLAAYGAELGRAADAVAESAVELAGLAVQSARDRDAIAADFVACVKAWPK